MPPEPRAATAAAPRRLAPGAMIGMLGGGQLGRMTALAAARLGYRMHILDPDPDAPAGQVAAAHTIASFEDPAALSAFAAAVDVVTLEWENVPVQCVETLAAKRPVWPSASALAVTQDRLCEKTLARDLGLATAPWWPVDSAADLARALRAAAGPAVLKTRRLGYDGRGQWRLGPNSDVAAAHAALAGAPAILEAQVSLAAEVSQILARHGDGTLVAWPLAQTVHRDGILARTMVPAAVSATIHGQALQAATTLALALEYVGVLAVEFFVTDAGQLLVNELAPRPHNSGHWTIDACPMSQFEAQVRVVCGLPPGDPTPRLAATMDNLLGDAALDWPALLAEPGAILHLYGKREIRPGRKMGHVTRLGPWPSS